MSVYDTLRVFDSFIQNSASPNPEQTASLLSLIFFTYLDSLIWKASKVSHLSTEGLPPLSDSDQARILRAKAMSYLDPLSEGGNRHVFFNILRVFPGDMLSMSVALVCNAITAFIPAVATNRLLVYLETRDSGNDMLPWFWISLLLIGPITASSSMEWYMRVVLRTFVRVEALLTELIFEHAMRARVRPDDREGKESEAETNEASTANINTLITVDLKIMEEGQHFLVLLTFVPIQIVCCIVFLHELLGWSAFIGLGLTVALVPITGAATKSLHGVQEEKMKRTDSRVRIITDGEPASIDLFRKSKTLIAKGQLSASKAFPSIVVFDAFRNQIQVAFIRGAGCVTAKVSLNRINKFLQSTDLLDDFDLGMDTIRATSAAVASNQPADEDKLGFHTASFSWSKSRSGTSTPSTRNFVLTVPGNLQFKSNALNLVVGPTGSGKTSLLLALLGEMHYSPLSEDSWFNLPRQHGVSYAAQESWVLNETVKDNILFGSAFEEERYKKVVYQCALERDLSLFAAGDQTEIGEKGLTLSGGQKARLTLARAVYSQAKILLLDDILAALEWIVNKCLSGDLLKNRTVIIVSHNVSLLSSVAQCFVTVQDGVAYLSSNIEGYLNTRKEPPDQSEQLQPQFDAEKEIVDDVNLENGKLIVSEEIHEGASVGWVAIKLYINALGGKQPFVLFITFVACLLAANGIMVLQTWYLGYWASLYQDHPLAEVSASYHLGVYSFIFLAWLTLLSAAHAKFILASIKASEVIHNQLVESVLAAKFSWLDKTPVSRIVARFTQDIGSVDFELPTIASRVGDISVNMLLKIGAVVIFTPAFLLPSIVLTAIGVWVGTIYLKAQSSVKREMLVAKAPVIGLVGASSAGIISVRAFAAQERFADLLMARIDHYSRSARVFYNLQRWMAMRTETLAGIFSASLAWYLVYFTDSSASDTGFVLNLAVAFSGGMVWWVIAINDLEAEAPCLERLDSYLKIDHEARVGDGSMPPAHWPSSGELRVENLHAKYSPDGPDILHGLSFRVESGERIGVVGRTGSGKSTLTLALLRCILTSGSVYYGGILTSTLNLDALRSQITIIPQTPELISGTLRQNLDPFEEHEDYALSEALKSAGLTSLQEDLEVQDRINLDTVIANGGMNLSVGQRQIIALARAIVRRSKLLILDEATSAVDHRTDTIIQESLQREYMARGGDATIITIAHRLQTIMEADRIMVLDEGRIVEFDSPRALLEKQTGQFRAMVENASDRSKLLAMVKG
ncbi:P-loop containing nucleoside triphosphate hydrolase protein [Lentinula raphanica]|uniref:P-loop containing nucleoside triphosphate hydrolase protein n=1 Tax=Lentinula raphanica TaxID=153919 RepID=A0AA38PHD0_9AGAR|nr:P-loop containing nucleoside triphosphate hydrolase protein [Lentinula raphanica]KAJ3977830.1 P-loop containing nucleoside triphosphate hydrolase protein [Lentinula raphanica]